MISLDTFKKLALELPEVTESIHFSMVMFGVGKKNFATFDPRSGELSLKLPLADPSRTEAIERGVLTPVPGKYGAQGWATVDLERIAKPEFVRFLKSAHREVTLKPKATKAKSA
ncbi:MAG: MmcQ/YjbR family DNA-binding protein [Fibrobacterota bacterium]|nr:MmcQ/YjbR family DNA-binding protein [Fibrobacterota bacterium]QQS06019.1 MAG: MmcQ/YjbR family DNA-binding protein [Fibrobacterota bacterium]